MRTPRDATAAEPNRAPAGGGRQRLAHLDVVRVAVIVIVIVGHAWAGYDAIGGWAYTEAREASIAPLTRLLVKVILGPVALFAMGLLFLVAGLLTPGSVQRKGPGRFARDRLARLGAPLLVFTLPTSIWARSTAGASSFCRRTGR